MGEEECREKPEGVGTGRLLKGARGYLHWRTDLHQASEMTQSDPPKDSKGKPGETTLAPNHKNTESCKFERRPREKGLSFPRGIFVFQIFICFISYFVGSEFSLVGQLSCFTVHGTRIFFFFFQINLNLKGYKTINFALAGQIRFLLHGPSGTGLVSR